MDDLTSTLTGSLLRQGSLAVIGRPGTGKTSPLADVYGRLVTSIDPSSVLVLSPDRDHADVLRNTLPVPREAVLRAAPARSISSFAYGIVRAAHATRTGRTSSSSPVPTRTSSSPTSSPVMRPAAVGCPHGRPTSPPRCGPPPPSAPRSATPSTGSWSSTSVCAPPHRPGTGSYVFAGLSALDRVLAVRPDPRWAALSRILEEYLGIMSMPGYGGSIRRPCSPARRSKSSANPPR